NFTPAFVIEILFAPARVASSRLDVTVRGGTNPHIGPCRRNREPFDPQKPLLVANQFSIEVEPGESTAVRLSSVARSIVTDITQTGSFGCVHRFSDNLCAVPVSIFGPGVHLIKFADRRYCSRFAARSVRVARRATA